MPTTPTQRPNRSTIELPPQMWAALDQIAATTGRKRAEIIRELLQRGIDTWRAAQKP